MSKKLVMVLKMEEVPDNCLQCDNIYCGLPLARRRVEDVIRKPYRTKRHKDCPLSWVDEERMEKV